MAKIKFTGQAQKQRGLKRAPSKYKESAGRPNISMSPGVAPAYPAVPFKYLPVSFQDENTQDWVVMPKGKLASMVLSTNTAWDATWQTGEMGQGLKNDGTAWGAIQVGDDEYYGVSKNIKGLLVPANGGNKVTYTYGTDDAKTVPSSGAAGLPAAGNMVQSGDELVIAANAPVGVMEHDVYQDIRGANLNYDMRNKNWGVLAQQFIKLPCVDIGAWNSFSGLAAKNFLPDSSTATVVAGTGTIAACADAAASGCTDLDVSSVMPASPDTDGDDTFVITKVMDDAGASIAFNVDAGGTEIDIAAGLVDNDELLTIEVTYTDPDAAADAPDADINSSVLGTAGYEGYNAVNGYFGFLTFNSEKPGHGLAGGLLKSDCFGNWKHEGVNPQSANRTAQTVGRLLGVDYRFDKDLLGTVQSRYEDQASYRVASTGTYGVPQYLYNFAYKAMNGAAFDFSAKDEAAFIKDACDAGVFGEAWIQLNCQ